MRGKRGRIDDRRRRRDFQRVEQLVPEGGHLSDARPDTRELDQQIALARGRREEAYPAVEADFRKCAEALLPSNIPDILGRRALSSGRLAALGATLDFHHGLLREPKP
jgi:hypothetical protein